MIQRFDYTISKPQWVEITEGHFVYGNEPELEKYRAEIDATMQQREHKEEAREEHEMVEKTVSPLYDSPHW